MQLKMLADKVLMRRAEAEAVSPGGIIIPEKAKEKSTYATVVAVGPGKFEHGKFVETTVKEGEMVLLPKWGGDTVKVNGEDLLVVVESDILAIVED